MSNDSRTRDTGRRKEEGEMSSLFCPWLKDNIGKSRHDAKA